MPASPERGSADVPSVATRTVGAGQATWTPALSLPVFKLSLGPVRRTLELQGSTDATVDHLVIQKSRLGGPWKQAAVVPIRSGGGIEASIPGSFAGAAYRLLIPADPETGQQALRRPAPFKVPRRVTVLHLDRSRYITNERGTDVDFFADAGDVLEIGSLDSAEATLYLDDTVVAPTSSTPDGDDSYTLTQGGEYSFRIVTWYSEDMPSISITRTHPAS